ncbi:MAG: PaaI family thioesterase [Spirochaetales bacterium]|nr:PaaI family thioesterase [Candidatus Physcosoma equi]
MIDENAFLENLKAEWGISVVEVGDDYLKTEMTLEKSSFFNPLGIVYGGVLFQLSDVSAGIAARVFGLHSATAQGNINYYRAVKSGKVQCICRVEKIGSRLSFLKSTLFNDGEKPVAEAQFIFCPYESKVVQT